MSDAASGFDPNLFLDAQQTEVNESLPPLPIMNPASPDGLYLAVIGEPKTDSGTIGKGDRIGEPWVSVIIPLKLEIPQQIQDQLGYPPTYTMTDRAFLDLTPQKTIDNSKGKNKRQKEYRDALDMNAAGVAWAWRKASGQVVKVKVEQEMYEGRPVAKPGAILHR